MDDIEWKDVLYNAEVLSFPNQRRQPFPTIVHRKP